MRASLSILLVLLLLTATNADSQPLTASWSLAFGDADDQRSANATTDPTGNIYLTGYYGGNQTDVYLAKYDSDGIPQWSQHFGGGWWQVSYDVAIDPAGNVIIVGGFTNTIDFGGGPLISAGPYGSDMFDIFIAKFDSDGNHIWSRSFGSVGDDIGNNLCIDGSGEITIAGTYMQPFSIDGTQLPDFGYRDFFVAAFTADGAHKWSWGRGGSAVDICGDIALDPEGNLLVAGSFSETVDFGGGPLTAADGRDVFLAKYDQNGVHLWSRQYVVAGDNVYGYEIGVCTCDDSSTYLSGFFSDQIDLGLGALTSAGFTDVYLAKIDQNGTTLWSNAYGDAGANMDSGGTTTIDGTDVVMTGWFGGEIDFGGGPLTDAGIFLTRLDQAGSHVWSHAFGGNALSWSVVADAVGSLALTGTFTDNLDFGNGPLVSAGGNDIFLARFDLSVSAVDIVPGTFGLELSAHPNPFNPRTTISFECKAPGPVQLAVYDLLGRRVTLLVDGWLGAGHHEEVWNGRDITGRSVATGQYLIRLNTQDGVDVQKVILEK